MLNPLHRSLSYLYLKERCNKNDLKKKNLTPRMGIPHRPRPSWGNFLPLFAVLLSLFQPSSGGWLWWFHLITEKPHQKFRRFPSLSNEHTHAHTRTHTLHTYCTVNIGGILFVLFSLIARSCKMIFTFSLYLFAFHMSFAKILPSLCFILCFAFWAPLTLTSVAGKKARSNMIVVRAALDGLWAFSLLFR